MIKSPGRHEHIINFRKYKDKQMLISNNTKTQGQTEMLISNNTKTQGQMDVYK